MNTSSFALLALSICSLHVSPLLADTLDKEGFTLSGSLYQNNSTPNKPVVVTPLTKKSLLVFFGHPEVNPAKAKFFYDETTQSDVLASADGNTIYGTLFTYSTTLNLPGANGKGIDSGSGTMLDGKLSGTYITKYHDTDNRSIGTVSFIGNGSPSGVPMVIKGTFTYSE